MPWPTPQDYNEAVQNPKTAFLDPDLRGGQAELTPLGLPRPMAGGFACVYTIKNGTSEWAARCFLSEVPDQQERYNAISAHLRSTRLSHLIDFSYLSQGIKVGGKTYPIIKMPWQKGVSLSKYVEQNLWKPGVLMQAARDWSRLLLDLKNSGIAHGDLQHGNIFMVNGAFKLLDYDGMFVPSLQGKKSNELGHRNYQLPSRTERDFGTFLDNFSGWVVYISLVALSEHPDLWKRHRGGDECLLFRRADYQNPDQSSLLRELSHSPSAMVQYLAGRLKSFLPLSPADIPAVGDLPYTTAAPQSPPAQPWWDDHAPRGAPSKPRGQPTTTTQSPPLEGVKPSWIIEAHPELGELPKIVFTHRLATIRTLASTSFAIAPIAGFTADATPAQHVFLLACAASMSVAYCFARYRRDPHHRERHQAHMALKSVKQQLGLVQSRIADTLVKRSNLEAKLRSEEISTQDSINNILAVYRAKESQENDALQQSLAALDKQHRDQDAITNSEIQRLEQACAKSIQDIESKLSNLGPEELRERKLLEQKVHNDHIMAYLSQKMILGCHVSGISPTIKRELICRGIKTAADVSYHKVTQAAGVGQVRGQALVAWRQAHEAHAMRSAPQPPEIQITDISNRYAASKLYYTNQKASVANKTRAEVSRLRMEADSRGAAIKEEKRRKSQTSAALLLAADQDAQTDIAFLKHRLETTRKDLECNIQHLKQPIITEQNRADALLWQAALQEKGLKRFNELRFLNYICQVIGL